MNALGRRRRVLDITKALGLTTPPAVFARADQVLE
jgi:hypothetical protein